MPPRSRNFDGCWTCRSRKIKCDCTKPVCLRCQRAKLNCKGYSIVLAWADTAGLGPNNESVLIPTAKTGAEDNSMRRNVDLVRFPRLMQYGNFAELNKVVYQFDDVQAKLRQGRFQIGPFGVFDFNSGSWRDKRAAESQPEVKKLKKAAYIAPPILLRELAAALSTTEDVASPPPKASYTSQKATSGSVELESTIFSKTENSYVHYALLDSAKLTILAIKGVNYDFSEQSMFHILYPKFYPNMDSDDWRPNSRSMVNYFFLDASKRVVVTLLLGSVLSHLKASQLTLVRVLHPANRWDTHVVPFVRLILFELVCEDFAASNNWRSHYISRDSSKVPRLLLLKNIKLGILCMSLSISSFQKSLQYDRSNIRNEVDSYFMDEDLKLSIEMRKLGINILNYHLDEYDNTAEHPENDDYVTCLLLAMILQIHVDNSFGVFENYELIYAIGDFVVKSHLNGKLSPLNKFLKVMFEILTVFYESTQAINFFNYSISEKDQRSKYLDLNDGYDLTKDVSSDEKSDSDDESGSEKPKDIQVKSSTDTAHPLSFTVYFNKRRTESEKSADKSIVNSEYKLPRRNSANELPQLNPVIPQPGDPSVYVMYGLPKLLINLFHEVIQLANHKNVFRTRGVTPRNFPRICAETEDKIQNWNVESYWKLYDNEYNPISNVATKLFFSQFHEGLYYNVTSFHAALVVYYKRLIPSAPLQSYQKHIGDCFNAMECLLKLNEKLPEKSAISFVPSFWPLLVCGCDIGTNHPYLSDKCQQLWKYECFKKYNYWRSKQILFEVWQRRSEGDNNGFMDMIREWDIVLNLG